ncbi:MAG: hypothetical protein DRP64_20435 [Verrucomicrobia bacterium]|nr:MAG: hypothetical protein DRP64_20435 [Verrucomicrobiota bacterium]
MKITRVLTKNQTDVDAAFRLMVFNILAHNRDDHVKNFSFMLNERNEWRLTPAYDLTFTHGPGGEHTMTVAGEGRAPDRSHIMRVADGTGITKNRANETIGEVSSALSDWLRFADEAGVRNDTANNIKESLLD